MQQLEELPVTDVKSVFIGGTTGGNLKDLENRIFYVKGKKDRIRTAPGSSTF